MEVTKSYLTDLIYRVNGAAIEVHKAIGPGLIESVYHRFLKRELFLRKIRFQSEMLVNVEYKGDAVDTQLRCDLFLENILPVELKSVDTIHPVHEAQIMTYMTLLKAPKGLMLNFNVANLFREGQRTFVNEQYRSLPA